MHGHERRRSQMFLENQNDVFGFCGNFVHLTNSMM